MSQEGTLKWHSSREVVGEKMDMKKKVEQMRKREEEAEIYWCRHGVWIAPITRQ